MLAVVDEYRYFSYAFMIFSKRLSIGLFELRNFAVLSKPCFDKVGLNIFFDGSDECSLCIWTVFIVVNGDLLVHAISTKYNRSIDIDNIDKVIDQLIIAFITHI